MLNILKETFFPHGIGQLISLLMVLSGMITILWAIKDNARTNREKLARNAKCRAALRRGYERNPETEDGYELNLRIHEIR